MEIYLKHGKEGFAEAICSQVYVDKTGLIAYTNKVIGSEQRHLCVSRPRWFGKTRTGKMLAAYYSRDSDSTPLFTELEITQQNCFEKYVKALEGYIGEILLVGIHYNKKTREHSCLMEQV